MPLAQSLTEYIRACFTGIWIESHEHQDALAEIAGLCRRESWRLATWDIDRGLDVGGNEPTNSSGQDPLSAIRALSSLASADGTAILVLQIFHRFLQSAEILQALARQIMSGKQHRTFVVTVPSHK
ncbi:MAG: hypothetical protein K8U03_19410 [Planctomycetia bacterium]|nr:hypothetical protein [Planctomycetia bacterium]